MISINTIKKSVYGASAVVSAVGVKAMAATSGANTAQNAINSIAPSGTNSNLNAFITNIINVLIAVIGVAAVLMLIIGGFRYVFSQGNEKAVSGAKDTILYAIIGIVVAILAFAIVNFVIGGLNK